MNLWHKFQSDNCLNLFSRKLILIILLTLFSNYQYAQNISRQVINSGSFEYEESGILISLSLAEPVITTIGNSIIITQGFLQSENFIRCNEFKLIAFPNPVADQLTFSFEGCDDKISRIVIFDLFGKVLLDEIVEESQVNLEGLRNGIYILKAFNPYGSDIGTVKIAKADQL